jgi:hypothetical protein
MIHEITYVNNLLYVPVVKDPLCELKSITQVTWDMRVRDYTRDFIR